MKGFPAKKKKTSLARTVPKPSAASLARTVPKPFKFCVIFKGWRFSQKLRFSYFSFGLIFNRIYLQDIDEEF